MKEYSIYYLPLLPVDNNMALQRMDSLNNRLKINQSGFANTYSMHISSRRFKLDVKCCAEISVSHHMRSISRDIPTLSCIN